MTTRWVWVERWLLGWDVGPFWGHIELDPWLCCVWGWAGRFVVMVHVTADPDSVE